MFLFGFLFGTDPSRSRRTASPTASWVSLRQAAQMSMRFAAGTSGRGRWWPPVWAVCTSGRCRLCPLARSRAGLPVRLASQTAVGMIGQDMTMLGPGRRSRAHPLQSCILPD
jgi:hypothetical protein